MAVDWETDLADELLEFDGKPAVYEDEDGNTLDLVVLFNERYMSISPMGLPFGAMRAEALGKISALAVVKAGRHLTVAGRRWIITDDPQPDGTCWTTLVLGEAVQ